MQPTRLVGDHFGELVQSYDGFQMYIPNTSSSLFRLSVGELVESCDGFADVHSEHKIQLVQVRSGRTDIYMSACKVDEAHFKTIRSSAPGLRRVCAGSAPGLRRVCAGSAPGLRERSG